MNKNQKLMNLSWDHTITIIIKESVVPNET